MVGLCRTEGVVTSDSALGTGFPSYPPSLLARSVSTKQRSSPLNRSSSTTSSLNKQPFVLPDPFSDENEFYDPRGLSQRRRGSSAHNSVAGSDSVERNTHSRESSVGGSRPRLVASSLTMSPKGRQTDEWQLAGNDNDGDVKMAESSGGKLGSSAALEVSNIKASLVG